MAISISCGCGKKLSVRDGLAGKKVKCPGCAALLKVPVPSVVIEELPDRPKVSGDRILTSADKEWEQDRSFPQIVAEMMYKPGPTLEILSAYVGKPSVVLGMVAIFFLSLIPAGVKGYFEILVQASQMREEVLKNQKIMPVPLGGAPAGPGMMLAAMDEARKEQQRSEWYKEKSAWEEENNEKASFPVTRNLGSKAFMISVETQPSKLLAGDPFTLSLKLADNGNGTTPPEQMSISIRGPMKRRDGAPPEPPLQSGTLQTVSPGVYQYVTTIDVVGYYHLRIETPPGDPSGTVFRREERFGAGERQPPESLRTMPADLDSKPPPVAAPEPPRAVATPVKVVSGGIYVLVSVVLAILKLVIIVAVVELVSRLFSSGSEFLFMAATLAFVDGLTNFYGLITVVPYALGHAGAGFGLSLSITLYGVLLTILAIGKVYHLDGVQAIFTAVMSWGLAVLSVTVLTGMVLKMLLG